MSQRRRLTVLAAALALAAAGPAPTAALAQSAGDDQYEDPFAGQDQGGSGGESQEQPPAPATDAPAPAEPTQAAPAQTAPGTDESAPATTAADPGAQPAELPRTGLDAAPILALGALLLAGGIALRLRLRERA